MRANRNKVKPERLLSFLTLAIYIIFTCSVVYNYAYFLALGITLSQIPITISDIINTAFVWMPFVTIMVGSGFLFILITKRIEQGMTEEEIINSTSNPMRTAKLREMPFKVLEVIAIIAVIFFFLFGQQNKSLLSIFLFFMVFWFWFGKKLSDHPRIIQRRSTLLRLSIVFLPVIVGFIFARGYDDAIDIISKQEPDAIVQLTNGNKISVVVLRNFDKGILVRKLGNDSISFLFWRNINNIDMQYHKNFYRGLF